MTGLGLDVLVLPFVIGTAALSGASFNDLRLLPLLFVVFIAAGVANITNDIIDAERDKTKWPLKPLSTGLISKSEAVLYAAILSAIGIVIAIVFFNWLLLTLGLLVVCGEPRLLTLYARQHRVSYGNGASGVSSCGSMECFFPRDRLNSAPVALSSFFDSIPTGDTNHA